MLVICPSRLQYGGGVKGAQLAVSCPETVSRRSCEAWRAETANAHIERARQLIKNLLSLRFRSFYPGIGQTQ